MTDINVALPATGENGWAAKMNTAISAIQLQANRGATALDGRFVPGQQTQSAESTAVTLFRITPNTTGWGDFKALMYSIPSAFDSSVNHAAYYGWNVGSTHNPEIVGKVALAFGIEDNFYDKAGDGTHGPEFYLEQATPDGSAALFRPFYARGSNETGHNRWNVQFDIGTDTHGLLSVFAGKGNPALFAVSAAQVQFNAPLLMSGSAVTYARAAGQAVFIIQSVNPTLLYQTAAGVAAWYHASYGIGNFTISDQHVRAHLTLTSGATPAAALTDISSSVKIEGNVGFGGVTPIARRATTADAIDLASVITLANALKADLIAYGLKS